MSAFNTIKCHAACPFCGNFQIWTVQYKYGDCWQYEYEIGDKINWNGNDNGENIGGSLRTEGIAEERCQKCGKDDIDAEIHLFDNMLKKVVLTKKPLNLDGYYEKL